MDREVLLTVGYSVFLTACAGLLGATARRIDETSAGVWARSEDARLRRGIALAVSLLNAVLLCIQMVRYRHVKESSVLVVALLLDTATAWRSVKAFHAAMLRREAPPEP